MAQSKTILHLRRLQILCISNPATTEKRKEKLESSLADLTLEVKNIGDLVVKGFTKIDTNFDAIGKEIKQIHFQVNVLNKKIDDLKGDTNINFDEVDSKLENLTEEISKIGKVINYEEYFKNVQLIKN